MAKRDVARTSPSIMAVGVILVLLSASGMLAGVVTHRLRDAATPPPLAQATATTQPASTSATTPASTATSAATAAATASTGSSNSGQFTFSVAASPKSVAPGQNITITVTAVQKGTQIPFANLQCYLRQATSGGQSLFATYPPPATTNNNGIATWTVAVPGEPPGSYRIEVVAYGTRSYNYFSYTDVTVTG